MTTAEDRELYRVTAQVRKARKIVKALTEAGYTLTPAEVLSSSDDWRRQVEAYANVSKSSDVTWSIVACLLEDLTG